MRQFLLLLLLTCSWSYAQEDSLTTQDAIYDRPFVNGKNNSALAIGGYVEGNTNYFNEDGSSEGFSMEMRRFNIFMYSSLHPRIKFLSEIEFEHGTEEIAIETAQLDLLLHPLLVLRGGIILVPLGNYNVNHDSPKWEFIDRPLVTTQIIPSTLSDVGFGLNGKWYGGPWIATYDAYLVNGLQDGIIFNDLGRTDIASGKNPEGFGEDNNGSPALAGRVGLRHRAYGELGFSIYNGIYNSYKFEGEPIERKRDITLIALDFSAKAGQATVNGEAAWAFIDVPYSVDEIYGKKQWGGYVECIYPVLRGSWLGFDQALLNTNLRLEMIDYNSGKFSATGKNIFDEVKAIVGGLSFRPTANTVFKANYRYHWIRDILGNPSTRLAGFQFGFATYF